MSFTAQEWTDEYERTRKQIVSLRSQGGNPSLLGGVEQSIDRLEFRLGLMEQNTRQFHVAESELARRRELIKGLRSQAAAARTGGQSGYGAAGTTSRSSLEVGDRGMGARTSAQVKRDLIAEQDELLEDLGRGVDRLRQHGMTIKDETQLHKRLLDDIDGDVESAATSLKMEARHAERIREQASVCRLYICIAVLSAILVLLLIIGFS